MTFAMMQRRLLVIVRERVGNGEITESHLARLMGISQSHIHNVLKGVRKLSSELADQILSQLRLNADDLLAKEGPVYALPFRSVPLLSGALGSEMESFEPKQTMGSAQVPAHIVALMARPLAIRLGNDSSARPRFEQGDLVLIDLARAVCRKPIKSAVYVVTTAGGPRLRYIRQGGGRLYLASEECIRLPAKWESVLTDRATLLSKVRGRVVWVSRHFEMAMVG